MADRSRLTRRDFVKGLAGAGVGACFLGGIGLSGARGQAPHSTVFRVEDCPVHDKQLRHVGVDVLLGLLAARGVKFYRSSVSHPWAGTGGIVSANDIVVIKVNCQWRCRGTTNTDVVRGVIHRILQHPDGFKGEVVVMENGQGRGGFDGLTAGGGYYNDYPELKGVVAVNSEQANLLTVSYLVNTVFSGEPVSSFLLDGIAGNFIEKSDHTSNGYRRLDPPAGSANKTPVSYPCFTTTHGNRIELHEGRWTGSSHSPNVKLLNIPVLKDHGGSGMTGTLKHCYGILSMQDGQSKARHYGEIGSQCAKMWTIMRKPDLHILDCIWVCHQSLIGYPANDTRRCNILLAGTDPVAIDYYAAKHILHPLGGSQVYDHDPDNFEGMIGMLTGAKDWINANGGVAMMGDANTEVVTRSAKLAAGAGWGMYQ